MAYIIENERQKESVIKAVKKLMKDGRGHSWLQFLVDVQSAAIQLNAANIITHMDENLLQSMSFRVTDLSDFFTDLIDILEEA